ncbi:MAG: DUF1178 family protein [Deltaproteobacteria bacterium]|nr:DUF1178 family protein [Deltaproteobacteria bacterium]
MMVFDLRCENGHMFEGWFQNANDFEEQSKNKFISCPICNSIKVVKAPSKVSINITDTNSHLPQESQSAFAENPLPNLVEFLDKNFENVGSEFAKETLKMHYGVSEKRNIRGTSTAEEEKTLEKEGIKFYKVPIPQYNYDS